MQGFRELETPPWEVLEGEPPQLADFSHQFDDDPTLLDVKVKISFVYSPMNLLIHDFPTIIKSVKHVFSTADVLRIMWHEPTVLETMRDFGLAMPADVKGITVSILSTNNDYEKFLLYGPFLFQPTTAQNLWSSRIRNLTTEQRQQTDPEPLKIDVRLHWGKTVTALQAAESDNEAVDSEIEDTSNVSTPRAVAANMFRPAWE